MKRIHCKFCKASDIVKRGVRKTKKGATQIYHCNECKKRFSTSALPSFTYSAEAILAAPTYYFAGFSLEKTKVNLKRRFKINPSIATVSSWVKKFGRYSPMKQERENIRAFAKPTQIIKRKLLKHDQTYLFQAHLYKLSILGEPLNGLRGYLETVLRGEIPKPSEFSLRCSELDIKVPAPPINPKKNYACSIADIALKAADTNFKRHAVLQRFFLSTDRATLGVEVPVFLTATESASILGMEGGMLGHIDFLQVYENNVTILDYKPNASKDKHVHEQLLLYAIALSTRTRLHLRNIRCAWFDERGYYSFPSLPVYMNFRDRGKESPLFGDERQAAITTHVS